VARAKNFSSLLEVRRHPFDSSLSKAVVKEQLMATHTALHSGQPTEQSTAVGVDVAVEGVGRSTVGCSVKPGPHIRE
jgi:hypothetical protein